MWKLIILSSFLIVIQANQLDNIYGKWTQIAFYPRSAYIPVCIQYLIEKDSRNIDCSCTDGKTATLVALNMVVNHTAIVSTDSDPVVAFDSHTEAALNVGCTCGVDHFTSRLVAKLVNSNVLVLYEKNENKQYTESEPNNAYVFTKKVPKMADLTPLLESISDLKNRDGAVMCASDVNLKE